MNSTTSRASASATRQVPYYDENYFRASGDTDVRQVIAFSGGWDLPFDRALAGRSQDADQRMEPISDRDLAHRLPAGCARRPERHQYRSRPRGRRRPQSVRADLVLPNVATYNPRNQQTINGNTGNYFFNPLAFSNGPAAGAGSELPKRMRRG